MHPEEQKAKERAQKRARDIRTRYMCRGKTAHVMYLDREWLRLNAAEASDENFKVHDEGDVDRYIVVVKFPNPGRTVYWREFYYRCIKLLALKNGLWLWIGED